jgi:hypothetical protein
LCPSHIHLLFPFTRVVKKGDVDATFDATPAYYVRSYCVCVCDVCGRACGSES